MRMHPFHRLLWLILCAGCALEGESVQIHAVDFGLVEVGASQHRELVVQNVGSVTAKLLRVERLSGANGFTVTPAQVELAPGERVAWNVAFFDDTARLSQARFVAVFDTGNTEFTLRARAGLPCAFAQTFDVGDARIGTTTSRTFTVSNPLDEPGEVFIGAPSAPFFIEPSGTLRLAPEETREVTVRFSPSRSGHFEQPWVLAPSTDCTATRITLTALALEAPLSFSPGRLDFGTLAPGVSRTIAVELRNHMRSDLTLTSLSFSSPAFRASALLPLIIPASGATSLTVEATASDSAPFDGTLRANTDAGELTLPLLGNRTALCLSASRVQLEFTPAELTCRSHDELVTLTNTCPHQVMLTDTSLSPGFVLIAGPTRLALAPGEFVQLALSHAPSVLGAASGSLRVSVDVLDGTQLLTVPLAGTGTPASLVEESERLPPEPQRDVLLVIDDSPSMLPLAANVRRNLGQFALESLYSGEDVRIGVMSTSTAPSELARLRRTSAGASWLENPTAAELESLSAVQGLSTSRSSCLEVLLAAFSLRTELGAMLRPRALLQVVCITNGADGLETAPRPAITALLSSMPRPHVISVVAHLLEVPGCEGVIEHGFLSLLATETNGVREEICAPRWSLDQRLSYFGGYRTNFYLHQQPSLLRAPLRVWVDEVELPDDEQHWTYESVGNFVSLQPLYTPAPGQLVRFRYAPDCQ